MIWIILYLMGAVLAFPIAIHEFSKETREVTLGTFLLSLFCAIACPLTLGIVVAEIISRRSDTVLWRRKP